jgi:hypothetical protein
MLMPGDSLFSSKLAGELAKDMPRVEPAADVAAVDAGSRGEVAEGGDPRLHARSAKLNSSTAHSSSPFAGDPFD